MFHTPRINSSCNSILINDSWSCCVGPNAHSRPSVREAIRVLNLEDPLPLFPRSRPVFIWSLPPSLSRSNSDSDIAETT
ncbi:Concanavalin A-like lectin protein kinase family protein [Euphorbia peplus]|nr:Concanavalin A-like lectin protein kinase family protein [Euphorbia peplus]